MLMKAKKGFTLIELMIVIAIIAIIAAIAIPGLLQSQRASNERSASASLKTVATAETDFRANDRDANKVNDFWTFDLKGLYTMTPYSTVAVGTTTDTIRLIELSVAGSDAAATAINGAHCVAITLLTTKSSKAGYWYAALTSDLSTAIAADQPYVQNTTGSDIAGTPIVVAEYNNSRFGFMAMPDSMSAGRFAYMMNEANTVMRRALTYSIRVAGATNIDIRTADVNFSRWPNDTTLKNTWGKMD